MSTAARSKNQKKVVRLQSQDDGDEEQDGLDEMPMSQGSMSSSDAGYAYQMCSTNTQAHFLVISLVAVVAQQMKGEFVRLFVFSETRMA